MILTEADLHAYNAGELSDEARRVLEADPLAVQDAARLRAISHALKAEVPMVITGRAETIERLRRPRSPRIGVSPWVWAAGAGAVAILITTTVPRWPQSEYSIRTASYGGAETAGTVAPAPEMAREIEVPRDAAAPELKRSAAPLASSSPMTKTEGRAQAARPAEAQSDDLSSDPVLLRNSPGALARVRQLARLYGAQERPPSGARSPDLSFRVPAVAAERFRAALLRINEESETRTALEPPHPSDATLKVRILVIPAKP